MKKIKVMVSILTVLTMMAGLSGCASQDDMDDIVPVDNGDNMEVHHARMILDGTRESFGDTRAAVGWEDGDKVYLQFSVSGQKVSGQAVYKAGDDEWDVQYHGTITKGEESACEAYFFDGAVSATSSEVVLDTHIGVYQDKSATYLLKDGVIRVTAMLSPKTGRFRFKGTGGTPYTVSGFKSYTRYNISTNAFQVASVNASESMGADGYSAYYYGYFEDEGNKVLTVTDKDNWMQYTKVMDGNALKQGHSGSLRLPTTDSHSGWTAAKIPDTFIVNGVSFKMIWVEGGTFTMGATAEQSNGYTPESDEKPTHSVTLSSYAIGETEVTQAMWEAVTGYSPTSDGNSWTQTYGQGDSYPAYYISYEDVQSFITKLNSLTGKKFRMPTEAEWEFAARGGNKSNGYIFSGSNTIGDVAWYYSNSSKTHPVKTKAANELGIYDMSGNVWEWCSDWYGSYSSTSQSNPAGPTIGTYRVFRGGGWDGNATDCRCASRYSISPSYRDNFLGFRLAL